MSASSNIVFFGTSDFAVEAFSTLRAHGVEPLFVVTTPDAPTGRTLRLTPPPVKVWASAEGIEVLQPTKLKTPPFAQVLADRAPAGGYGAFIVASYGKILPTELINLPARGTLNIHPSLLPKYRGPAPIQSAILADDKDIGVSIMQIDEAVDHGPLLARAHVTPPHWPLTTHEMKQLLAHEGAALLAELLPGWLAGTVATTVQDDTAATFTKKFEKADGELDLSGDPYQNFLRFKALVDSPGVYCFEGDGANRRRLKIVGADYRDGRFVLTRVVPEGRKEMDYEAYQRGRRNT